MNSQLKENTFFNDMISSSDLLKLFVKRFTYKIFGTMRVSNNKPHP